MSHHVLARLLVCGDRQYNFRRRHGGIAPVGRGNNHPGGALALRLTERSMRFHLLGMQTAGRACTLVHARGMITTICTILPPARTSTPEPRGEATARGILSCRSSARHSPLHRFLF